jgi:hypothetical protein
MLVLRTPQIWSEEARMPGEVGVEPDGPARHDTKERR